MWRLVGWGSIGVLGLVLVLGVFGFLQPPASRGGGSNSVDAQVRLRDGETRSVIFSRGLDRWTVPTGELPIGSVAHVAPRGSGQPGFFVVRADSGAFRAYSDRNGHRGEPVQLRQPLVTSFGTLNGAQLGYYDSATGSLYTLDGEPLFGPAPRPLDPFPLRVEDERLEIGTHAVCPDDAIQPWCGPPDFGPRTLEPGYAVVLIAGDQPITVFSEPGLQAGDTPTRRLTAQELRAYGFTVVSRMGDLDTAVRGGARVVWVDARMLDRVSIDWAQAWYRAGVSIGVLGGTMADLAERLGIGSNYDSWIQPGTGRPVFAMAMPNGLSSDWLSVSWLLSRSQSR